MPRAPRRRREADSMIALTCTCVLACADCATHSSLAVAAWGVVGPPQGAYRGVPIGSGTEDTL